MVGVTSLRMLQPYCCMSVRRGGWGVVECLGRGLLCELVGPSRTTQGGPLLHPNMFCNLPIYHQTLKPSPQAPNPLMPLPHQQVRCVPLLPVQPAAVHYRRHDDCDTPDKPSICPSHRPHPALTPQPRPPHAQVCRVPLLPVQPAGVHYRSHDDAAHAHTGTRGGGHPGWGRHQGAVLLAQERRAGVKWCGGQGQPLLEQQR